MRQRRIAVVEARTHVGEFERARRARKDRTMLRRLSGLAVAALSMVLVTGTAMANENHHCNVGLLDGLYVFTASGFANPSNAPSFPKAIIEVLRFHGDGTVTTPFATVSMNGKVFTNAPGGSGTYTVAALDPPEGVCAGTLTFSDAPNPSFNLVIPPSAERIWLLMTNPPSVFEGNAVKVAR
jgi:hypothetical protein